MNEITETWKGEFRMKCKERKKYGAKSCLTCNPMNRGPPGCSVHGILQARVLEGVPRPSPGELPNPGIKPRFPHCRQVLYGLSDMGCPTEISKEMESDS